MRNMCTQCCPHKLAIQVFVNLKAYAPCTAALCTALHASASTTIASATMHTLHCENVANMGMEQQAGGTPWEITRGFNWGTPQMKNYLT